MNNAGNEAKKRSAGRYLYLLVVFFLTLTGFAQMPIFKRYYIADIPGLGWLAQFYVTHYMHYLFAIVLLAIAGYWIADYWLTKNRRGRLTVSGYVRASIVFAIIVTGALLVIRNLPDVVLSPNLIIFLDVAHLGLAVTLLAAGAICLILKKPWVL